MEPEMKEAYLYEKLGDKKVRCFLCNHQCVIGTGKRGLCQCRENRSGTLVSLVYGKVIARHCDPIEKKPLFHFLPGSRSYSIATAGCNFRCLFCQNADISQLPADYNRITGEDMTPEEIVRKAVDTHSASISYTYTEPTIYFELAADTARIAAAKGLKNVFVSNGYMTEQCLQEIFPDLHAANVDLKAFSERFYKEQCGAKLEPVLKTLATMKKMGIWVEITTLLIPGLNDSPEELKDLSQFISGLDPNIPWHISRFHPTYRLTSIPSTPPKSIHRARDLGYEAGLRYVYTGNLPGDAGEKTFCHECGELLIDRFGFNVTLNKIMKSRCPACSAEIPGIWTAQ
jgi:pyruvate formate lyase activating enzyme